MGFFLIIAFRYTVITETNRNLFKNVNCRMIKRVFFFTTHREVFNLKIIWCLKKEVKNSCYLL